MDTNMDSMKFIIICKEISKATGEIYIYKVSDEITANLLTLLNLRSRLNLELKYFVLRACDFKRVEELLKDESKLSELDESEKIFIEI